jgi:thymidine kinase
LVPFALAQAERGGRDVIAAGLSCDFRRRSFGDVVHLVPHAARVETLTARCFACGADARYTVRVYPTDGTGSGGSGSGSTGNGSGSSNGSASSTAAAVNGSGSGSVGSGSGGGPQTLVGGSDRYRPACTACYRELCGE